jgi:hypothetical protein
MTRDLEGCDRSLQNSFKTMTYLRHAALYGMQEALQGLGK